MKWVKRIIIPIMLIILIFILAVTKSEAGSAASGWVDAADVKDKTEYCFEKGTWGYYNVYCAQQGAYIDYRATKL